MDIFHLAILFVEEILFVEFKIQIFLLYFSEEMLKPLNEERNFKFYFWIIYYDINLATQQQNSKIDFCFVNFFYL